VEAADVRAPLLCMGLLPQKKTGRAAKSAEIVIAGLRLMRARWRHSEFEPCWRSKSTSVPG
jgi:hypothetical protein